MKITTFAQLIAEIEGKKKEVDIGQISEILRVIDDLLGGSLYAMVRLKPEPRKNAKK